MKRSLALIALVAVAGCGGGGGGGPKGGSVGSSTQILRQVLSAAFDQPMQYVPSTSNADLAYVVERPGRIRVLVNDVLQVAPALDISSVVVTQGECGLAGMTLAPDFATSRSFYLYYNTQTGSQIYTRVTRYTMASDGLSASGGDPIFRVAQPFENHKGGAIHFGPDGFLYLGLGDGGSGNDPDNRAQDPTELLGKMLRIDPSGDDLPTDSENNYRIPSTNPFASTSGVRGEIWDFGMRNPFRWSFDSVNGAMIVADVGQGAYEEIDYEPAGTGGRNYGWRVREGLHPSGNSGPLYSPTLTDPTLEYDHSVGSSIIGGFNYHGTLFGAGGYLFADYVSNKVWILDLALSGTEALPRSMSDTRKITPAGGSWNGVVSIDPDGLGRPIVVELNAGRVSRLTPTL